MNTEDQFEERLRHLPQRPVPPAWRNEILSAAHAAAAPHPATELQQLTWLARLNARLVALFWPHPVAWAGLAAVWLVVLGLNSASQDPVTRAAAKPVAPISGEMKKLLHEQELLFAELAGRPDKPDASSVKPSLLSPRSQRREDFANA